MNENETIDFEVGQKVQILPSPKAPPDLIEKVRRVQERLGGPLVGRVGAVFSNGACTVVLPIASAIEGHSHRLSKDTEYIDLGREHLEAVT